MNDDNVADVLVLLCHSDSYGYGSSDSDSYESQNHEVDWSFAMVIVGCVLTLATGVVSTVQICRDSCIASARARSGSTENIPVHAVDAPPPY